MKELDKFSKFENGVYLLWAIFMMFGLPLGAIYLLDKLFLKELSPFIRYPVWIICGVVAMMIGFVLLSSLDNFFLWARRLLGKKPLTEIQSQIHMEDMKDRIEKEAEDERRHNGFIRSDESEQRYRLWIANLKQIEHLTAINKNLDILRIIIIVIIVLYIAENFFK